MPIVLVACSLFIGFVGTGACMAGEKAEPPGKQTDQIAKQNAHEAEESGDKIYLKNGQIHYGKIQESSIMLWITDPSSQEGIVSIHQAGTAFDVKKSDIVKVEKRYRKPEGLALEAKDENWGPVDDGLQTQLIPITTEFQVGKPMVFALLLKNVGTLKWYDIQGISHDVFTIQDSEGSEPYCKIRSHQTMGSQSPIDTGEIDTLLSARDLAQDYVIYKPGTYKVWFCGGRLGIDGASMPRSNVVTFTVKEGTPSAFDRDCGKLIGILPERWHLSGNEDHLGGLPFNCTLFNFLRSPESGLKDDVLRAELCLSPEPLPSAEVKKRSYQYLGKNDQGCFYGLLPEPTQTVWPTFAIDIVKALGLETFAAGPVQQEGKPMSIIALPAKPGSTTIESYVKLQLPYGLIISNADTKKPPSYYLFCRDNRTIVKTDDVDAFLAELERLPDGVTIDRVSKCTVGFYTQHGVKMDKEYERVSSLLKRKRFKLVSSLEEDPRHASFCYCETGFIILDKARESEEAGGNNSGSAALPPE